MFVDIHENIENVNIQTLVDISQLMDEINYRMNQVNKRFPTREGSLAITKLQEAIMWFDKVKILME